MKISIPKYTKCKWKLNFLPVSLRIEEMSQRWFDLVLNRTPQGEE